VRIGLKVLGASTRQWKYLLAAALLAAHDLRRSPTQTAPRPRTASGGEERRGGRRRYEEGQNADARYSDSERARRAYMEKLGGDHCG